MTLSVASYDEWRVCGRSDKRGPWEGAWTRGEFTANHAYDVKQLKARNEEVWIEHRTVTISNEYREEVE